VAAHAVLPAGSEDRPVSRKYVGKDGKQALGGTCLNRGL